MRKLIMAFFVTWCACSCGDAMAKQSFMPDNDLYKQDRLWDGQTQVTEALFNEIINRAQSIYGPIARGFGVELVINPMWWDSTVNAQAYQEGRTWYVDMFGGLARRREITAEGFSMVLCHEIGHHFGGFPNYPGDWAALEGQSDYFAAQVCMKKVFAQDNTYIKYLSAVAVEKCKRYFSGQDRNICFHLMSAAKSTSELLGALNGERSSFETPSTKVVSRTDTGYPSAQCRLDSMTAGALCVANWNDGRIPRSPDEARNTSCLDPERARPRCWFAW